MWQPPSLLSSTHRQTPASNLRLLGPFIFILAPHSSKFLRCGHSTQTGTPHPSATRGCCGLHQFFIMCATSRRLCSTSSLRAARSPRLIRSRQSRSCLAVSGRGNEPEVETCSVSSHSPPSSVSTIAPSITYSPSLFRGYAPPTEKCQSRLKWTKPSARFAPPPKIPPDPCRILDIFAAL